MNADANLTGNFQFVCRQMGNRRIKILNYRKEKQPGLLERLTEYAGSDAYPFHMPGHKRREIPDGIPGGFPDPYGIDITEIDGFDNLHHAEGILKDAMETAAAIYGADRSWYLVNGSTCGILSAVFATTENGGKILTARNCHKAVYHAICLNRLEAEYLYPEEITEFGINGGIRAEDVRKALEKDAMRCAGNSGDVRGKITKIQAVLITSPTYEGVVSDIRVIADVAHEYGIPLIVDEAHGAHLIFHKYFPDSAVQEGADLVIQSTHKTLPSFTQTAVLHLCSDIVTKEQVEEIIDIYETSSPSYLLMASAEYGIMYMKENQGQLAEYVDNLKNFRRKCEQLQKISLLNQKKLNCFAYDNGKLVFSVKGCGINGKELFQLLYEKYHIELEMENLTYGIAMTSICDKKKDFDELWKAISEIDKMCEEKEKKNRSLNKAVNEIKIAIQNQDKVEIEICDKNKPKIETKIHNHYKVIQEKENEQTIYPPKIIESWQCRGKAMETVELADSTGRVSGKYVMIYPPGVPILVPGEKILKEIVENISQYLYNGYNVLGLSCNKIIVLKDL